MKRLEVNNIVKKYDGRTVVGNVRFSIDEGEIVGFLGPNGAGKSTVMKIIAGCLAPDEGDVLVAGKSVGQQALLAKQEIGYLPEDNPLYEEMYVREYLDYALMLYKRVKDRRKIVNEIVEATRLSPEVDKQIGQLSKGYRQRVGLAQALIHDPQLLVLDEPFTGLDPLQIEETGNLIRSRATRKAVLFSSHTLSDVASLCTRIILIDQGKIALDKPMSAINDLAAAFKELTGK